MLEAALWSAFAGSSLLLGVELTFALRPTKRVIGLIMAFGSGAMISAVAYELVLEAVESGALHLVALGMALGTTAFFVGDLVVDRAGGEARKRSTGEQREGSPLAIVLGAALDAVPESLIVGLSIVLTGGASLSFVAATFASNLPESMAATSGLDDAGWKHSRIRLLWLSVVGLSMVAGAVGYAAFAGRPESTGAFVQGFAAGALLTMLADTMMPEAFQFAGRLVGVLTVVGFATTLAIAGA